MAQRFRSKTIRIAQADNAEYSDAFTIPNLGQSSLFSFQARSVPPREGGNVPVTNVSNANPAVVTSAGHGLVTGATVDTAGWTDPATASGLNDNAITRIDDDTFSLDGINTLVDNPWDGTDADTAVWSSDAASTMTFDVEVSADGQNWAQIIAAQALNVVSSGTVVRGRFMRIKANVSVDQQSDLEVVIQPLGNS